MQFTLSRQRTAVLPDEAAAAVANLENDVWLSLCGIAARRAETLTSTAGTQYRSALLERTDAAWKCFAVVLDDVLSAASEAPPESISDETRDARLRLLGFLDENPDLGGNRSVTRPS